MSRNDEPTSAAMIAHYIQCTHTLACARKDIDVIFGTDVATMKVPTESMVAAAAALDEAVTNMAKLISALALGEMPRRSQVTS